MPQETSADLPPCAYMAALIALLDEMPTQRDRNRVGAFADRLDRLERAARGQGAPLATLAAIKGARVLLDLAELPPLQPVTQPGIA